MNREALQQLYAYNAWANARLLDQAALVSPEQLVAPTSHSFGSLLGTLVHTMSAEWLWRTRMQQGTSPSRLHTAADFPTLAALRTHWQAEQQAMQAFLATLRDSDLMQPMRYTDTRGQVHSNLLWEALTHLVLHGMQHRSEAAAMLTDYGHSPGWIDFILYVREQQQPG